MATLQRRPGETEREFQERKKLEEKKEIIPDMKLPRTQPQPVAKKPIGAKPPSVDKPDFLGKFTNIAASSPDAPEKHESGRVWNPDTGKYDPVDEEYKKEKWQRIGGTVPASAQVSFENANKPLFLKGVQDQLGGFDPYALANGSLARDIKRATPHDASSAEKKSIEAQGLAKWKAQQNIYEKNSVEFDKKVKAAKEETKDLQGDIATAKRDRAKYNKELAGVYNSITKLNQEAELGSVSQKDADMRMAQYSQYADILKGLLSEADSVIGDTGVKAAEAPAQAGAQEYDTPDKIATAFRAGKITRDQAKQYFSQIAKK